MVVGGRSEDWWKENVLAACFKHEGFAAFAVASA